MADGRAKRNWAACAISLILPPGPVRAVSARRQHHDDLAAFEARLLLDLGEF